MLTVVAIFISFEDDALWCRSIWNVNLKISPSSAVNMTVIPHFTPLYNRHKISLLAYLEASLIVCILNNALYFDKMNILRKII